MNSVNIIGRITKDLELKSTSNGQGRFVSFTVAVSEYSQQKEITNFIPCFAFERTAENMVKFLSKGSLVSVSGRISVRTSQKDGKYETITTITADRVNFLGSSKNNENTEDQPSVNESDIILESPVLATSSAGAIQDEVILSDDESTLWD
ncbi:single-strand DNA-binding protein [Entomoplasma ellychniae]|uniref:Single-stranded DNA-binding protein n=1 Tax=Entomoplasma ellychniae TaxID=2114 RepID=A0A8E2QY17_9MOLU|nr:single-stranded DNA-binding protein [Entomoplasma ellychniae]PPE04354.1 single-strand DNA-binding protein [Entomoplasma ellychniae]PPE04614.1 single-strand DNA-binding protein [Entomoplasma ellychniae]PPE04685.1 single-strand DNA-binding protein [Entomoplasma ellychniae]